MTRAFYTCCDSIIKGGLQVMELYSEIVFDAPSILWYVSKSESVKLAHDIRNTLEGGWKDPEAEGFDVTWIEDDYIGIEHDGNIVEIQMFDAEELCEWLEGPESEDEEGKE